MDQLKYMGESPHPSQVSTATQVKPKGRAVLQKSYQCIFTVLPASSI
jgi:hypothetical protein